MSSTLNHDQFYTSDNEVDRCMELLRRHYNLEKDFDLFVEPAAGSGAFLNKFPVDVLRIGFDIEPKAESIERLDFILNGDKITNSEIIQAIGSERIVCVTNPPFGRRGSLAFQFIDRIVTFADTVAIVLPRIFAKDNFIKRWDKNYHLVDSINVDSFVSPEGKSFTVRCVFQIWQRREEIRLDPTPITEHPDFHLTHAHMSRITEEQKEHLFQNYPHAVGQVSCKFITDSSTLTKGSYWFIKPNHPQVEQTFKQINFLHDDNYTTHKSLSKSEIIELYIREINEQKQ